MANTITFTPGGSGGAALTVTPVPGTMQYNGDNEDRGGGNIKNARAALTANGQCQVELDTVTVTAAALKTLHETTATDADGVAAPIGEGAVDVTGAGVYATVASNNALINISRGGDAVAVATISWKGSAV